LPGRGLYKREGREYETLVLLVRVLRGVVAGDFGERSGMEATHFDEKVAEWADGGGFRRSFCSDIWNMHQLRNRISTGA
jgi:hypothetical protein